MTGIMTNNTVSGPVDSYCTNKFLETSYTSKSAYVHSIYPCKCNKQFSLFLSDNVSFLQYSDILKYQQAFWEK